jgi:hypothetical protein
MGTNSATPTDYDDLLDLLLSCREANGNPTTLVWAPRMANTLAKLVTGITSDLTKLRPPDDVLALMRIPLWPGRLWGARDARLVGPLSMAHMLPLSIASAGKGRRPVLRLP